MSLRRQGRYSGTTYGRSNVRFSTQDRGWAWRQPSRFGTHTGTIRRRQTPYPVRTTSQTTYISRPRLAQIPRSSRQISDPDSQSSEDEDIQEDLPLPRQRHSRVQSIESSYPTHPVPRRPRRLSVTLEGLHLVLQWSEEYTLDDDQRGDVVAFLEASLEDLIAQDGPPSQATSPDEVSTGPKRNISTLQEAQQSAQTACSSKPSGT